MHNPPLILIADDEPDTLDLLTRICHRAKYQTLTSSNGRKTVELAQEVLPDLVLLDIQMPGMTGLQVMEYLRNNNLTQHIPIIVITATATRPEQIAHGIDLGADDYMPKPFNYHELLSRIRSKLRNKELEEILQRRTEELEILVRLGITLNSPLNLLDHIHNLLPFLCNEFEVEMSLCYILATAEHPAVNLRFWHAENKMTSLEAIPEKKLPRDQSAILLSPKETQELFQEAQLKSGLAVSLNFQGKTIGLLGIADSPEGMFDSSTQRVMQSVSHQVALTIRNAHLYESLRNYANELEQRVEERTLELQQAQTHLIRSEKLASLGRLAGEIAHEVNNPLQPIMTCLEGALEDLEAGDEPDPQDLETAINEVKRLARIVTRLMDFARPERTQIQSVNLHHIIDEVLALTHKKLNRSQIEVITDLKPCPTIQANGDQLKQVILNMAINAIDAMSEQNQGQLRIQLWHEDDSIYVSLQDTGKGIPPEISDQIFEPFFSTKDYGSGMGLAISHSIIVAHGGSVHVTSALNVGTEFTIRLPV